MASTPDGEGTMLSRTLRETLDSVVAPHVGDTVIQDALLLAQLRDVPEEVTALQAFTRGPLRLAVANALGSDLARSVTEEIVRTLGPALDSERPPPPEAPDKPSRSTPPTVRSRRESAIPPAAAVPPDRQETPRVPTSKVTPRVLASSMAARVSVSPATPRVFTPPATPRVSAPPPATPRVDQPVTDVEPWPPGIGSHIRASAAWAGYDPPPPGMTPGRSSVPPRAREEPFVLVATEDEALFRTLVDWFHGRARVNRVRSATELVRHLDGAGKRRCIVLLDGKLPSVRPAALIVLLEDHPQVEVVLCRAAPAIEQVILASPAATDRWLVYREPASLDHVAAECLRLVS